MVMVDHCNRNPWKIGKDKLSITKTHVQTGFAHEEDRFVKPCNLVRIPTAYWYESGYVLDT